MATTMIIWCYVLLNRLVFLKSLHSLFIHKQIYAKNWKKKPHPIIFTIADSSRVHTQLAHMWVCVQLYLILVLFLCQFCPKRWKPQQFNIAVVFFWSKACHISSFFSVFTRYSSSSSSSFPVDFIQAAFTLFSDTHTRLLVLLLVCDVCVCICIGWLSSLIMPQGTRFIFDLFSFPFRHIYSTVCVHV